uniref:Uncharacterized protein n=1 Tax=Eutreptiella gymnastica TaxID=73025 RepID=A0A7S1IKU4_9EUGL|mmetsp:Transcript_25276/g.45692  ORF Transcript_25276/g.45692 Transcript_25276/m.45692 type:complete len:120 (+) Transcript_25276:1140-1499(+)
MVLQNASVFIQIFLTNSFFTNQSDNIYMKQLIVAQWHFSGIAQVSHPHATAFALVSCLLITPATSLHPLLVHNLALILAGCLMQICTMMTDLVEHGFNDVIPLAYSYVQYLWQTLALKP